jgi:hypothetical protein
MPLIVDISRMFLNCTFRLQTLSCFNHELKPNIEKIVITGFDKKLHLFKCGYIIVHESFTTSEIVGEIF